MIKVLRIILLSFPVLWTNLLSQQLSHQVLVPLAGVVPDTKISYSQTVGETMVDITGCSYYIFTQGFQQPSIKIFDQPLIDGSGVRIFPNPVTDFLTIEMYGEKARTFKIEFLDLTGRVVRWEKKTFGDQYWYREPYNVEEMISGFYLIRIMSEDGLFNRSFRIQKI
jgi:hypothetical protein